MAISALIVVLALTAVACAVAATALLLRRTTISIIIRKDPDMATIKERLAALEAGHTDHDSTLANAATTDQLAVVKSGLDHLTDRVSEVEADIGTDAPAAAADPAPVVPASDDAVSGVTA